MFLRSIDVTTSYVGNIRGCYIKISHTPEEAFVEDKAKACVENEN